MNEPLTIRPGLEIPAADLSYAFSRASGPGGQHVNTTDTRVRLRFDLEGCTVLRGGVKRRLREAQSAWLTNEGELLLTVDQHRSRHRNIEIARERLAGAIRDALVPPKPRRATRPSRSSVRRRLEGKKKRGDVKKGRGRVKE